MNNDEAMVYLPLSELKNTEYTILEVSRSTILEFMRTHSLQEWRPEEYWWFGLIHAWGFPRLFTEGSPITLQALNNALLDLEVSEECIRQSGAHTFLSLDNISFVYREKQNREGQSLLRIAPHIKGASFITCAHSFMNVRGSAYELAQYLIDVDNSIPSLKLVCADAYQEGLKEQKKRNEKLECAKSFLNSLFDGVIPSCIVGCEIADSIPGAADIIRLVIHDSGTPFWRTRSFDVPYDERLYLTCEHVRSFIEDSNIQFGKLEVFDNQETGERIPVIQLRPYVSEAERLGDLD